ncbi:WYL domain-containing protein [Weeksellaceae bacterium KMM 9724]|uniref:helix-turn-helix transcriptional regulator n=1 Tax=Profundicola chukchiensis TaxID=2961959 RepID=UPI00243EA0BD|nr:WYL domain-containing protein [Profundicola chukchiensis]MDG4950739.1 WYL domain-containing protein [Profundicola chukchiensis]
MANSTHAHLRYNILDYCFREKSLKFDELLEFVNSRLDDYYPGERISVRTLRDDIKLFRDKENGFGAPLPVNLRTYQYSEEFSIAQRPLLEYEQYLMNATQELLARFENHPKYNKLAEALVKFQDEEDQDIDDSQLLFYDHNEEYKGISFLKPLYLSIKKKQVLKIKYKGFKDVETFEFEFHPHILKQYNRRWFVYGRNESRDIDHWSIPLDERLQGFTVLDDVEYKESSTDWDSYFRTMVGITRHADAEIVRVVLKFYNGREHYFKTKPFQPDYEEFLEDTKRDQVWFDTVINRELVQQLLSYGKDVQVIEPEELINLMRNEVIGMNDLYV